MSCTCTYREMINGKGGDCEECTRQRITQERSELIRQWEEKRNQEMMRHIPDERITL